MTTAAATGTGATDTGAATTKTDDAAATAAAAAAATAAAEKTAADKAAADAAAAAGTTGKTGDDKAGSKAGETTVASKVPDKYSLAIPDDAKDFVDNDLLTSVATMARESGWSNEDAQNAVNEHALMLKRADAGFLVQLKADADYGGEHLAETQRLAKLAIDLVRPEGHARRESFMRAINKVAAGNHPEFVSFLADIGKRASEDKPGQQTGSSKGGQKTAEAMLYDKTPTK